MSPPVRYPPTMGANPHRTPLPEPQLAPTAVELRRAHGPNEAQERRSVAANSFRLLQQQGHIPREARLDADAPRGGGTYRSRMEGLVTDGDRDGHFDLDLAQLRDSGLVRSGTTIEQLDRAIAGDVRQSRLTDEFLTEQHPREGLTRTDRRDANASADIRFRNPNAWGVETYGSADEVQAQATSPARADSLARAAISSAQVMEGRGDLAGARTLLDHTSAGLQGAHQFPAARQVAAEMRRPPISTGEINLVQEHIDAARAQSPEYDPRRDIATITTASGNRTEIRASAFHSTAGRVADRRIAQMDQVERMESTLGRPVDPHNLDDAQAYLQQFSRGHSTDQVRQEYGAYLQTFYAHAGQGVTWDATMPVDLRPDEMSRWLPEQPSTSDGRRLFDCEGFIYLNQRLLPTLQDDQGRQRFNVVHGGNGSHVLTMAQERSGRGFLINNDQVGPLLERRALAVSAGDQLPGGRFSRRLSDIDDRGTIIE